MTEKVGAVPEGKKQIVSDLAERFGKSKTVLVASIKGLPASQFQKIQKGLRGKADVVVNKRSLVYRALDATGKGQLVTLKKHIVADFALFLSDMDAFELSGLLTDSLSPTKAKAGDIAPEDIVVEPGPTDLMPGPAISELGAVGLKVAVEEGKLAIKQGATIAREGEPISDKAAGVMAKLGIEPMKVGFIPVAAYDAESDMVYDDIKIDKEGTLAALREAISKSLGFAVNLGYTVKETIGYFIAKAGMEAGALEKLEGQSGGEKKSDEGEKDGEEKSEESKSEEAEGLKAEEEKKDE